MSWLLGYIPGASYLFGQTATPETAQAAAANAYKGLNNAAKAVAANAYKERNNAAKAAATAPVQSKANRIRAQIAAGVNPALVAATAPLSEQLAAGYLQLAREAKKAKNAAGQNGGKRKTRKRKTRGRK